MMMERIFEHQGAVMTRTSLSIVSALMLAAPAAWAADMAVKAPPLPPAPVFSWTGFYAGINVGYGWGNSDIQSVGTGTNTSGIGPLNIPNAFAFGGAHRQKLNGILGGDQAGYNYQVSQKWILGVEADIQAADQRTNNTFVDPLPGAVCGSGGPGGCSSTRPFIGAAVTGYQAKIEWFGTVRGRVGWLVTDQTFLYATGGLAYGSVNVAGNVNVSGTVPTAATTFTGATSGFNSSQTNVGWTAGGGLEGKITTVLSPHWSWKLEYLYLDLGSLNSSTPFSSAPIGPIQFSPIVGTASYHSHFTDNILRVGINYKLD